MPAVYGARRDELVPPDSAKTMKEQARASGLFPEVTKDHRRWLADQLKRIAETREYDSTRVRRMAENARISNQIELERQSEVLRQNRVPGLRGMGNRIAQGQRMAQAANTYVS